MQSTLLFVALLGFSLISSAAAAGGYTCASSTSFCANGGTCTSQTLFDPNYAYCACLPGYYGYHCEYTHVLDCWGNPAPNVWIGDGICNNGNSLYNGFYINLNCAAYNSDGGDCGGTANGHSACTSTTCGSGKCYGNDTAGSYWCSCPRNSAGANCQITVSGCTSSPCLNGARCITDITQAGNYKCVCAGYYYGTQCQSSYTPSGGSASCSSGCPNGFCYGLNTCACNQGYYPSSDQSTCLVATACNSSPCQNGGSCVYAAGSNTYSCKCASGYSGTTCTTPTSACLNPSNPCQHSGTCGPQASFPGLPYKCTCSGYSGLNCTFTQTDFDCNGQAFPPAWVSDTATCYNGYSYLQPTTSSAESRYLMVDCADNVGVPQGAGDPNCPSEEGGAVSTTSSLTAVVFLALLVLIMA